MATSAHEMPAVTRGIEVRRLGDEDLDAFVDLCGRQSTDSLRRQFFDPSPPSRERLARLAAQDDDRHVALVAVAVAGGRLVGAARYDRTDAGDAADAWLFVDERVADPALDLLLLTELARLGRAAGLRHLAVEVHPLDRALLETLDAAPLHVERRLHCGIVTVTVRLDAPPSPSPSPSPSPGAHGTIGDPPALPCRSVLVPVDGSPFAERAVAVGDRLARRLDAELHVATSVLADDPWWDDRYLTRIGSTHRRAQAHRSTHPDIAGEVARLARAVGPTVLCAATHGRSRSASVMGSTFLAIARRTDAPLVAVGPEAHAPDRPDLPIVVCLDGSPAAEAILPSAARWSRRLGAGLILLAVADAATGPDGAPAHLGGDGPDAAGYLDGLLARPELAEVVTGTEVLSDRVAPHHAIADRLARQPATLLALASRARTGLTRLAVGSEAARIVRSSPVPVLMHPVGPGPDA